jgi:hypothetical protein
MLPFTAVAAIDYAAYQSRPGLPAIGSSTAAAVAFTHSWLVPNEEFVVNFKADDQHQPQQILDPGHVFILFLFILIFFEHYFYYFISHR